MSVDLAKLCNPDGQPRGIFRLPIGLTPLYLYRHGELFMLDGHRRVTETQWGLAYLYWWRDLHNLAGTKRLDPPAGRNRSLPDIEGVTVVRMERTDAAIERLHDTIADAVGEQPAPTRRRPGG